MVDAFFYRVPVYNYFVHIDEAMFRLEYCKDHVQRMLVCSECDHESERNSCVFIIAVIADERGFY